MTRFLSWIIVIPLGGAVVALSISNRAPVALDLWPLPLAFEAPLFALLMAGALAGFLAGAVVAWLSGGRARQRARRLTRQLESARREEAYLKEQLRKAEAAAEAEDPSPLAPALAPPRIDAA